MEAIHGHANIYIEAFTFVVTLLIALFLKTLNNRLDELSKKLDTKVDKKDHDILDAKIEKKLNKEDFSDFKKEFSNFKECVYEDCEKKNSACSASVCHKMELMKNDRDKQVEELWKHCNSHSHTGLPDTSKVVKNS